MSFASTLNHLLPRDLRPVELATARYIRWSRGVVQAGPFRGMRYIDRAHCSALAPKIAGTYEQEIQPYLQLLLAERPDVFIDIGAAEGYYAVGAALAGWSPRIVAFESDPDARQGLIELMACNKIDPARIELRGICNPTELNMLLAECARPAVIMDVEGFEALLLDPLRVPHLARCRLLVEHHDFVLRGLRDEICRRMSTTHNIAVIEQAPRLAHDLVCSDSLLRFVPSGIRRRVLSEQRPFSHHGWLWLTPLAKTPATQ
jgi:hypothetical protein